MTRLAELNMSDSWKAPTGMDYLIFSAYTDLRPEVILDKVPEAENENTWAMVRIIGIVPVKSKNLPTRCLYKFSSSFWTSNVNNSIILESPAIAVDIVADIENHGMPYSAAFILCKLIKSNDESLPTQVTFRMSDEELFEKSDPKINFVSIKYATRTLSSYQKRFMAVCVPSLHHNYDKYLNLIEFIEFYRMMGVNHFTFYNTSITKEVSNVLAYYRDEGFITVLPWKIPPKYKFEKDLRYNGIFAALNDCLYRSSMIEAYKYIVNVDLDEFIVPRKYENYQSMMKQLDPESDDRNAVFIFRNKFFYLMNKDNPFRITPQDYPKLLLETKILRWSRINEAYDRSKYITRGLDTIELGNHKVIKTRKTSTTLGFVFKELIVEPEIAGVHHYRYCEVNESVCFLRGTELDKSALKYVLPLGRRVNAIYSKLFPTIKK
ncbi:uncharacterized protein LOC106648567 [Trichogramma pretiosum]|uniref:uncharacterized protein LOC106648567 n=1 Tax=Trichogramma pretiosum TaxID=7493 RepID=UPI000C71A52D|nr:uncharacterized protein LOC106648567 [Trichogramma pretiosum]XP_023315302.1 uncharacterized protein LOC106648567 [Trichogramma pretiosum]